MSLVQQFFRWTGKRAEAAQLVAEDTLTDEQIAEQLGISKRHLERWKKYPEFAARVDSIVTEMRAAILATGIAVKENRIAALDERQRKMRQIIAERAEDSQYAGIAGGQTGLIVHNVKGVGKGDDFQLIDLYEVDTGLLKELREHEKQAAIEVGQWTEKKELSGEVQLVKAYQGLDLAKV